MLLSRLRSAEILLAIVIIIIIINNRVTSAVVLPQIKVLKNMNYGRMGAGSWDG